MPCTTRAQAGKQEVVFDTSQSHDQNLSINMPNTLTPLNTKHELLDPDLTPDKEVELKDHRKMKLVQYRKIFNDHVRNKPVRHDFVHVLLLSWDPVVDDLAVKDEVRLLTRAHDVWFNKHHGRWTRWRPFLRINTVSKSPIRL